MASSPSKFRRILRKAGLYGGVFSFAFLVTLYWSFPYEAIAARVLVGLERQSGLDIQVGSLGPYWLTGLKAEQVRITRPSQGTEGEPLAIELPEVAARLRPIDSLLGGPAIAFRADTGAGEVTGGFQQEDEQLVRLQLDLDGLDLGSIPGLWESLGVGFQGQATGTITGRMPRGKPDQLDGAVDVTVAAAKFGGGMIKGFSVPAVELGDVRLDLLSEQGRLQTASPIAVDSPDLQAQVQGTVDLRPVLGTSRADLELRFKPTDAFWERNQSLAGLAQAMLRAAEAGDGFYTYELGGLLGRPSFRPRR